MLFKVHAKWHYPLRALIAISIGLLCYKLSADKFSSWILWTVVVLLQSTTGSTLRKSVSRVVGTLAGVLVGMLFIAILPFDSSLYFTIILLCLFLLLYMNRINYFVAMLFGGTGIIFSLVLMLSGGKLNDAWHFATARALDTGIGALIVIVVSYLFWPSTINQNINQSLCNTLRKAAEYTTLLIEACEQKKMDNHKNSLILNSYSEAASKLRVQLVEAKYEISGVLSKLHILNAIMISLLRIEKNMCVLSAYLPAFFESNLPENLDEALVSYLKALNESFFKMEKFIQTGQYQIEGDNMTSIHQILLMNLANRISSVEEKKRLELSEEDNLRYSLLLSTLRSFCVQLEYIFSALRQMRH